MRATAENRRLLCETLWRRSSNPYCTDQASKVKIFDRDLKRKQRDRAAWLTRPNNSLLDAVAENLLDRLEDCKKTFPMALFMGGSMEAITRLLPGRGGIEKLTMMDTSYDMLKLCKKAEKDLTKKNVETSYVVGDEEYLPVKESSVDLIISSLGLHWTNDLPGAMIQSRLALKPDGLFLAAIFGGETLRELRIACTVAQMEREGGISPRLSPLARILKRETALATAAVYESMFAAEDGSIPATFQVILLALNLLWVYSCHVATENKLVVMYMTGWREHSSQPKAKSRGSATVSFKDIQKQFLRLFSFFGTKTS